jgi:serine/threonine protein kinase
MMRTSTLHDAYFSQNAMEYIHEKEIRHKDIKPANILLTPTSVYYTDFGISQDLSDLIRDRGDTRTDGPYRGTARYFAPEVARDELRGRSADIFSLGCVFSEMTAVLNGMTIDELEYTILKYNSERKRLRYHEALLPIRKWFLKVKLSNLAGLPDGFYDLILRMIADKPDSRPSSSEVAQIFYSLSGSCHLFHGGYCCARNTPIYTESINESDYSAKEYQLFSGQRPPVWRGKHHTQDSQVLTDEMEKTTQEMHQITMKIKQEAISIRIITVLTLFFLPGTFISVRFPNRHFDASLITVLVTAGHQCFSISV